MNVVYDETGNVFGINRPPNEGELELVIPPSVLIYGLDHEFYRVVGGILEAKDQSEIDAIKAARLLALETIRDRIDAILAKQEAEGLKQYTIEEAENYINGQLDLTDLDDALLVFDAAITATEIKAALGPVFLEVRKLINKTKAVHLKEIPYLLD